MSLILCKNCGATISSKATMCPKCGNLIINNQNGSRKPAYQQQPIYQQTITNNNVSSAPVNNQQDQPDIGLNIISFLFPIVGWILYFVYKPESPIKALSCSSWAWLGLAATIFIGTIGAFI